MLSNELQPLADLIGQTKTHFETKFNCQQKTIGNLTKNRHEHETKNEKADDVHTIHSVHEEDPSP